MRPLALVLLFLFPEENFERAGGPFRDGCLFVAPEATGGNGAS
jgi:hypothetical protein